MSGSVACLVGTCGQATSAELQFPPFKNKGDNSR